MPSSKLTLRNEAIDNLIRDVREQKVILDEDLARIYGVTTKRLNEQVKRNKERFPADFVFQLTTEESEALRSQIATLKDCSSWRRAGHEIGQLRYGTYGL